MDLSQASDGELIAELLKRGYIAAKNQDYVPYIPPAYPQPHPGTPWPYQNPIYYTCTSDGTSETTNKIEIKTDELP